MKIKYNPVEYEEVLNVLEEIKRTVLEKDCCEFIFKNKDNIRTSYIISSGNCFKKIQ
jgi:Fe-S cluster biosynthesis and repair protein YggX